MHHEITNAEIVLVSRSLTTANRRLLGASRRTVVSDGRDWTRQRDWTGLLFFRVSCISFHNHSPLLTFFRCFIVLFQSCCSHAQVFGKTPVHEFPISYSHTTFSLRAPILLCNDVPAIKQPNYKLTRRLFKCNCKMVYASLRTEMAPNNSNDRMYRHSM